jgi:hypothetical protein
MCLGSWFKNGIIPSAVILKAIIARSKQKAEETELEDALNLIDEVDSDGHFRE